jgi:hypothetical protein
MRLVDEQIKILDKAICRHIKNFEIEERGALSQDILKNLRDFVEAVSVKASGETEYGYDIFQNQAAHYVSARADTKFLIKFHKYLQKTVSHYLPDEENSERLMLKYYEYLLKIKTFLKNKYNFDVLENIDKFPVNTDPVLQEYYEKIALKINQLTTTKRKSDYRDRYYIRKIKPFFVNQEVYYEATFTIANDDASKFDRVIAFTKMDILPNYSVKLSVSNDEIEILGKKMPIQIIDNWEVSIRPCELNYFADIFGSHPKISSGSTEARELMSLLTKTSLNLLEVIEFSDEYYDRFKDVVTEKAEVTPIFDILDKARELVKNNLPGSNIIRYLLYKINNKIIKLQYSCFYNNEKKLPNLKLHWGTIPFDEMPFATSPIGHNPKIHDLFDCINPENREHELFARLIKNNTEQQGMLYTPVNDLDNFEDIDKLMQSYNNSLYYKHKPSRNLEKYKGHIYIHEYEHDTLEIIKKLKELSKSGVKNYSNSVGAWLSSTSDNIDCDHKKEILKAMFENSHVALIYGAAGTGKTRLIEHISSFFHERNKLYLANTNPAVNNLQSRVSAEKSTFKTISSFLHSSNDSKDFDLLIIDECSTVSNSDMRKILEKTTFKLLILVGDIFQIESILFGNWFGIAQSFIRETSTFELTIPFRAKNNNNLLSLWRKVRNIEDDILEQIANNNYSTKLDDSIFKYSDEDEIILCLNYDGLYGINNINKFLQGNNNNKEIQWGIHTYKVGDPILFNESNRFKPLIHNNLKGKIIDIEVLKEKIKFNIEIDKSINELDTHGFELELLGESGNGKSMISFFINRLPNTDEDDNSSSAIVPFQVAYAVSIHKAQGLEYNSVKVVITDEIEEMVTHNIFYTAVTRAKEKLKIYWTPETEKKILSNLQQKFNDKDVHLLKAKFSL